MSAVNTYAVPVIRYTATMVCWWNDYNGKKKVLDADGLLATCLQHEMDHLEGILFIDYLSKLKRDYIIKKLTKSKPDRIVV